MLALLLVVLVSGCASTPAVVDHGFAFDMRRDGQNAVVLDYRYGSSRQPVRAPEWAVREGRSFDFNSVGGPMQRGDALYVKWRDLATGRIHEDTVDLTHRLPADLSGHVVTFLVRGAQLYVYLVSPTGVPRAPGAANDGPRMYADRNVVRIHPDRAARP